MGAVATLGLTIACSSQAREGAASGRRGGGQAGESRGDARKCWSAARSCTRRTCAVCHGEQGRGDGPAASALKPPPRDHTDRAYMSTITDEDLAKVIQIGGVLKNKPLMPGSPQIKGADLDALVAYVRSLSAAK